MTDDWKYQVSYKFGPKMEGMLNVRADTPAELFEACQAVADDAYSINQLGAVLSGDLPEPARDEPAQPSHNSVSTPANTYRRMCKHGARVQRTAKTLGPDGRPEWTGHFCPLDKSDPNRCRPEYE